MSEGLEFHCWGGGSGANFLNCIFVMNCNEFYFINVFFLVPRIAPKAHTQFHGAVFPAVVLILVSL